MADPSPLAPLVAALGDLVKWLRDEHVKGLVIGGVAASILGRPRATRDVDAVVWIGERSAQSFLESARRHGFVPRIADAVAFARRSSILLLRHTSSAIDIDVSLGALPFEREAIGRGISRVVGTLTIPVPTPEDLVVMKAVAHRPRDAADIESVLQANPGTDREFVRRWVREFAKALDAPDIAADLERIFARVSS